MIFRAYHGSSHGFKRFSPKFRGGFGGALGVWFASGCEAAAFFARPRFAGEPPVIYTVDLRMDQPYVLHGHAGLVEAVRSHMKGGSIEDGYRSLKRALVRQGYDGLVVKDSDTDSGIVRDDYAVWDADQITIVDRCEVTGRV
jgi:hypothetical protein